MALFNSLFINLLWFPLTFFSLIGACLSNNLVKIAHWLPDSGSVTAGNASTLNDGAAAVLLGSKNIVDRLNTKPLGKILAQTMVGIDPAVMGLGPVSAVDC